MSDTAPKDARVLRWDYKPASARQPKPGELPFEFYRESDHSRWRCELRDHGEVFGTEVQFYRRADCSRLGCVA